MGSMSHKVAILSLAVLGLGAYPEEAPGAAPADVSGMTLHVIPQSHIDLAWWWRYDPETLKIVVEHTLETAFNNFEVFPDYTFTFLQVPAIEPLETQFPKLFYKLRYYVHKPRPMDGRIPNPGPSGAKGRLAIGSGLWCEVDGSVPSGESLVRQCVYGKRYFQHVFGIDVRTAWFADAWTHPWTYPQILKKSGIDSYMFIRPRDEGESMFWWEAPDGSRVFAYTPFIDPGERLPDQAVTHQRLAATHQRYGVTDNMVLVGVGNHGGGAIREDVARMKQLMAQRETAQGDKNKPAKVEFSTPARFVESVLREPHNFPVIRTELEPTLRGAYTTVGEIKRGNRYSENLLLTTEKFSAIASWMGVRPYPQALLFDAWKKTMLNQFHDTISGTDVPPSIDDALRRYAEVQGTAAAELESALRAIAARINTKGPGIPLTVFNPLAWERTDIAEGMIAWRDTTSEITIVDDQGHSVPAQVVARESKGPQPVLRFAFLAESVPSLGYRTYWARPAKPNAKRHAVSPASVHELENEFFKVTLDPATGCLSSIYDKTAQREVLAQGAQGNLIQIIEDLGDSEGFLKDAQGNIEHNVWDGPSWNVNTDPQISPVEHGPLGLTVVVKQKFGLARFTQRITLTHKVPRIDFDLAIDWEGKNRMVKVAFPLSVSSPTATSEIPYGVIDRKSNGQECVAQNWVDISNGGYGVSLLNDSRYGHDFTENTIRISVLRSPDQPVAATDEKGTHHIRYALYPHRGSWQEAATVRRGSEFNTPMPVLASTSHTGELPSIQSFLQVSPENVVVSVLKKTEDSEDLILRCYESTGRACSARITVAEGLRMDGVHATDLLENSQSDLAVTPEGFSFPVGAWSIESFKWIRD